MKEKEKEKEEKEKTKVTKISSESRGFPTTLTQCEVFGDGAFGGTQG